MVDIAKDLILHSAITCYLIQYHAAVLNYCVHTVNTDNPLDHIVEHSLYIFRVFQGYLNMLRLYAFVG